MGRQRGFYLNSQQIREAVKVGQISGIDFNDEVEEQIQPNSMDLTLGVRGFCLPLEEISRFKERGLESFDDRLKLIENSNIGAELDLTNSQELKVGFDYLIPLRESVALGKDQYAKFSPKSSSGRTFLDVRLMGLGSPQYDLIHPNFAGTDQTEMYLHIRPLKFGVKVQEGVSLVQMSLAQGKGARVRSDELAQIHKKTPLLYKVDRDGQLIADMDAMITEDGLFASLGLHSADNNYKLENVKIKPGEGYILQTDEVFDVPEMYCAEMQPYSMSGLRGPVHFAGFFDSGFQGRGVIELFSEEKDSVKLNHQVPLAEFVYYRLSERPDKVYGKEIDSNYHGQNLKLGKYWTNSGLEGAVAMIAKPNPTPIDMADYLNKEILREKGEKVGIYPWQNYFTRYSA